jgi:predicted RNA-binding Zn-ribbon protein involved in translation (DUF1610 family)
MSMEIMKQAFDALREMHYALGRAHATMRRPTKYVKAALLQGQSAITALRQAIAEAERHVSYVCPNCHWSLEKQVRTHTLEDVKKIESKWSGLTEDDLASCKSDEFVVFAKTIEAKLKEKNNGN